MPKKSKYNEIACPACREPVAYDATRCPHCQINFTDEQVAERKAEHGRGVKFGFGCLGAIILGILAVSMCSTGNSPQADSSAETPSAASDEALLSQPAQSADQEASRVTPSQSNAIRSARSYLETSAFSRKGLIHQLSSESGEGYDLADATAAVDSLNVDWDEQAARSAKDYLDMDGFSCKGLIHQLSSSSGEGFTISEATYGAKQAGACN